MTQFFYDLGMAGSRQKPEDLSTYIDMALELDSLKACGAVFRLEDLTEGQWICLVALNRGRNKAMNEKQEDERRKAQH